MAINVDNYIEKAKEAIRQVYILEFHGSLGIPFPEIKMIMPDEPDYETGQYYITIDKTWQIHLNFGRLPVSYKEFQDEVKVLVRHEICHYMCCPYDLLTHLRMLKCISETYHNHFGSLSLNINNIAGNIANQIGDAIVDTVNFQRHPEDTLKSEINWIKKGADICKCTPSQKLMFLLKEALWGKSLDINETDVELLSQVKSLSDIFQNGGIDNKQMFLSKTEAYTKVFLKLLCEELAQQPKDKYNSKLIDKPGPFDISGSKGYGNNGEGNIPGRSKDGGTNTNPILIIDPNNVIDALEQFAQETDASEFVNTLSTAGINNISIKQKEMLWFKTRSMSMIPILEYQDDGIANSYAYPSMWRLGDPIGDLDPMLTFSTSPRLLPNITTKKWKKVTKEKNGSTKNSRDLLLILDTSGSMGNVIANGSNMQEAILASFGIIQYFQTQKAKVAAIGFSDRISFSETWTDQYETVKESLLVNGNGGTHFPLKRIEQLVDDHSSKIVTVLITDGELQNMRDAINYFSNYLFDNNKLYVLLLNRNSSIARQYESLEQIGANVWYGIKAADFCNYVVEDL